MMAQNSPLHKLHADLPMMRFGDATGADVVATFGELEAEYAALRKGCVLMDLPHRATVIVRGPDRLDFLNRMLTQELRPKGQWIAPWTTARSFWLNRKGRIDADLRLIELPTGVLGNACMVFDLDVLSASQLVQTLGAFIITEDVTLEDATATMHRLALHGPSAAALLADISTPYDAHPQAHAARDLQPGQATIIQIAGCDVIVDRQDSAGEIGLELLMKREEVEAVYRTIAQHARTDFGHNNDAATNTHRLRLAGWHAYNIARIEAGWPLFQLDFSSSNLPAESGVLEDRVSFTKGCYLGQEVVARMHSRGHSKQVLVALRLDDDPSDGPSAQPEAGADVRPLEVDAGTTDQTALVIGGITSSTRSPMLGDAVICFAQLKQSHQSPGTQVQVMTPAGPKLATVQNGLTFWSRR